MDKRQRMKQNLWSVPTGEGLGFCSLIIFSVKAKVLLLRRRGIILVG